MRRRRHSAALGLLAGVLAPLAACSVAGPRPGGAPGEPAVEAPAVEPDVRVGIAVAVDTVVIDGTDALELVDESGRTLATGAGPWHVTIDDAALSIRGSEGAVRAPGPVIARPAAPAAEPAAAPAGRVRIDGTAYNGSVLLRVGADGVTAVNLLAMESYLRGVVPLEIGAGRAEADLEAVKAQAVAARTYAIRHLGRREALGFDVYGTVLDQVYGGADAEDPLATRAVRETAGVILVHDGEPIEAFYHSTCGGRTAALEEVWGGDPRPYLRSVSDRRPGGGWYCESSNQFRWAERWDAETLHRILTATLQARGATGTVTRVDAIAVTGRTPSGRAEAVVIETNLGRDRVRGDSIRWVLRPRPDRILNSSAIDVETRGADRVEELVVEGAGWGHGIGMCQIGALGRARDGHAYRDILLTYYPGSRIERLY